MGKLEVIKHSQYLINANRDFSRFSHNILVISMQVFFIFGLKATCLLRIKMQIVVIQTVIKTYLVDKNIHLFFTD